MLPSHLAGAPHHDEVALSGQELDSGAAPRCVVVIAPRARPEQERSAGSEHEEGDHGLVEPAHVAIAVKGHAIAPVAVLGEAGTAELHPVVVLERALGLGQGRVRMTAGTEATAETWLVDPPLVAPHSPLAPGDPVEEGIEDRAGFGEPAGGHIDPALLVEPLALRCRSGQVRR